MLKKFSAINLEKIINILGVLYFFFLSRRGGDSKDRVAILIILFTLLYSIKLKYYYKYAMYKREIIIGTLYIIFVSISFFFSASRGDGRFHIYTHATIFSLGFFFTVLNYQLDKKFIKYLLPILIFITIPGIAYGLKDVYINYEILSEYRIAGTSYTTIYALELGMYFLIIYFSFFYYKNRFIKFILLSYIAIISVLILLTQSRNTFLMLPFTLVIILFFKNYKKGLISLAIFFIITILITKTPLEIKALNRINSTITSVEKIKKDARYLLFKDGIEMSKKNIIKGEGFYKYKGENQNLNPAGPYIHFHNIFIETSVTQGLITLFFYVLFLLSLFLRLIKNYFMESDEFKKNIKLLALAIFIFSHLYGLAEPIFYFGKLYQLIFTVITISVVIDTVNTRKI